MAKKQYEGYENHERWLLFYADFITLLFALFVVMYSSSSVNEGRFRTVSELMKAALNPGDSLPAMVRVSVAAMGFTVPSGVVMIGTIMPDGDIGPARGVLLEVVAARQARMRQVLVSDQADLVDADRSTPFLIRVSPVRTVSQALAVLTHRPARAGARME